MVCIIAMDWSHSVSYNNYKFLKQPMSNPAACLVQCFFHKKKKSSNVSPV